MAGIQLVVDSRLCRSQGRNMYLQKRVYRKGLLINVPCVDGKLKIV